MKRIVVLALLVFVLAPAAGFAVDGDKAAYMGGTLSDIKEKSEGVFSTANATRAVFTVKKATPVEIPYASIESLEYGQKAGRRVAVAVLVSPLALFSKKRNHYLTITYKDSAGVEQAAVFELGKDVVRTTLTVLELRSKKKIEFQDEEAQKALGGGTKRKESWEPDF
jgi:hypothetical protein